MIAGYGAVPELGKTTAAEKLVLLPLSITFTAMFVLLIVPVTLCGFGRFVP
jgi:hypothetical protein